MLLIPAFSAVITVGKLNLAYVFLLLSSLSFTIGRYPVLLLVKRWHKRENNLKEPLVWSLIYLSLSLILFLPLPIYYHLYLLGFFILLPVFLLGLNAIQVIQKTQRDMLNEFIGIVGLSLIAPAGYYALTGGYSYLPQSYLWFGNMLYFSGTIFYVKSQTTGKPYDLLSLIYYSLTLLIALSISLWLPYPWYIGLAFIPAFIKSLYGYLKGFTKPPIRTVGIIELIHSVVFGVAYGILLSSAMNV